jgi:hypothetical protein
MWSSILGQELLPQLRPESAPLVAIVLTLIGDVVFWIPAGFYLIGLVEIQVPLHFLLRALVVPLCTLGVCGCAFLMGRMPKLHVVWGSLVLLITSVAVAIDGYILFAFVWTFSFIFVGALILIVIGGILSIVWRPDVRLATEVDALPAP